MIYLANTKSVDCKNKCLLKFKEVVKHHRTTIGDIVEVQGNVGDKICYWGQGARILKFPPGPSDPWQVGSPEFIDAAVRNSDLTGGFFETDELNKPADEESLTKVDLQWAFRKKLPRAHLALCSLIQLLPGQWLDSNTILFCLNLLMRNIDASERIMHVDGICMSNVLSEWGKGQKEKIFNAKEAFFKQLMWHRLKKKRTGGVHPPDVLTMKLIIIPCNISGDHWNLIVLVNWRTLFSDEDKEKFQLLSIDSLYRNVCVLGDKHKVVLGTCLLDLYKRLCPKKHSVQDKVKKFDVNQWWRNEDLGIVVGCFEQKNITDCAVLVIAHVRCVLLAYMKKKTISSPRR